MDRATLIFSTLNIIAAATIAIATAFIAFQGPPTIVLEAPQAGTEDVRPTPTQPSELPVDNGPTAVSPTNDTWLISAVKAVIVFYGFALAALATFGVVAASLVTEPLDVREAVDLVWQVYWNDVVIAWFWSSAHPVGLLVGAVLIAGAVASQKS